METAAAAATAAIAVGIAAMAAGPAVRALAYRRNPALKPGAGGAI